MISKTVLILAASICFVKYSESGTVVPPFSYDPSDLRAGAPAVTNSPMNFSFSDVQPVFTSTRLSFISELALDKLNNTGKYISMMPQTPSLTFTTRGALESSKYGILEVRFFWSSDPAVPAGQVVNGVGEQIEVQVIYLNSKYNLTEAKTKPDGFVIITFRVRVDNLPDNPFFTKFLSYVSKIPDTGDTTTIPRFFLNYWFNPFLRYPGYFVYAGAYQDPITLTPHSAATIIVHTLIKGPRVSQNQLQQLISIVGYDCPLQTYAQDSRNVFWTGPAQEVLTPPFPISVNS